MIFDIRF